MQRASGKKWRVDQVSVSYVAARGTECKNAEVKRQIKHFKT